MMHEYGLVVEDIADTRSWLVKVLGKAFPELKIVDAADLASAGMLLDAKAEGSALRIALIDLGLPDGSGIDLIRGVKGRSPDTLVVVTTIYDDSLHLFDAIAAGADGYLLKSDAADLFEATLMRIHQGEPPLSPGIARRMLSHFRQAPAAPDEIALTPRENDVLSLLGLGMSIREIGKELSLSSHTVGDHVKAIYRKLHISSRAEAAVEAVRRRLL